MNLSRNYLLKFGAWFFLALAVYAMVISIRYLKYLDAGTNVFAYIYLFFAAVSHFCLLYFALYFFLYVPVAILFPNKKILIVYASVTGTFGIILLVLDTYVFDLYRFHINGFVLNLVFGGAFSQIFIFDTVIYLKAAAFLFLIFFIQFVTAKFVWKLYSKGKLNSGKQITASILMMLLATHLTHAWAYAVADRNIPKVSLYYPLFYPLKANNFIYKTGLVDPEKITPLPELSAQENTDLEYPQNKLRYKPVEKKLNILFLLIDAWHFETMNKTVTPHIAGFADTALNFSNHYSGNNGTRGGIFSIFYALPPLYWEDFHTRQLGPVLLDRLLEEKYEPVILGSAALTSPEFDKTVFASVKNLRINTPGNSFADRDIRITNDFNNFLDNNKKDNFKNPFFGFLFYDSPHNYGLPSSYPHPFQPYWKQIDFSVLNNSTDPALFFNAYKNTVWFCDSLINTIFERLKKYNLLSNTVVIITSDHGQEFNENKHNYWGHAGNFSRYQVGVPLIVWFPEKEKETFTRMTTHYDIVPTLMNEIFGCENPPGDYSIGKSLFDTTTIDWHIAGSRDNFAIIENGRINTVNFNGTLTITDLKMNPLADEKVNAKVLNDAMKEVNRFYK